MSITPQRAPAPRQDSEAHADSTRTRLLDLSVGLVEDVRAGELSRQPGPESFSPKYQVALPYRGIFLWYVGRDQVVGDANQVLFVTGGEAYRVSQPLGGGFGELIVTLSPEMVAELAHASGLPLAAHPLFRRRSRRATPRLQSFRAQFLTWASRTALNASGPNEPGSNTAAPADDLAAEELVLALLRAALDREPAGSETTVSTRRLIRRTKAFLEAELANPIRLADIARAVGASPTYLTSVFSRVEGTSLHRYLTQLRLARALVELPRVDDLTTLAVEIGFSSHSHFTAAFRRAFGTTPSEFRQTARRRLPPAPP